jgi:hypothetical protein
MHLSKVFLVSINLCIGIANASVLGERRVCVFNSTEYGSCKNSDGTCTSDPTCHNHVSGLLVIVPRVRQLCVAHVAMVDLVIECIIS